MPALPLWLPKLLKSRWLHVGLLALALGFAWLRGNHYRDSRDATVAVLNATRDAVAAATVAFEEKDRAQRIAFEARNTVVLAEARRIESEAMASGIAARDRYAAANRVRRTAPDCGQGGGAATTAMPCPAPLDDGPGDAPDMVAVTKPDFDSLTSAALRAAINQRTATALIDAGLAVAEEGAALPEPAFGGQ